MRFEVEVIKQDDGLFLATAVAYPTVSATGRTEKEALGLLMEAMGKHVKAASARAGRGPA
ncbi:MAG TPA: type II toxin-antitoxin system HicB family antitoxin [Candidatus Binatia bacterium]|nr:type II toxin-antitoxin system HicB family antitoxin [Candidatus Binatia bacterium]